MQPFVTVLKSTWVLFFVFACAVISGCATSSHYLDSYNLEQGFAPVQAEAFLGTEFMQGPGHRVGAEARSDGRSLIYRIETPHKVHIVRGTEQAKVRIREIAATEVLRGRSTAGAMVGAAWDRTANLVETPYRLGKTLVDRGSEVNSVGEAILFLPIQGLHATDHLLDGTGELLVTGARITTGAAGTKCSGLGCVEKVGADVWSGINSLAGKHNATRRLHAEFGTDPETLNLDYRQQIDRLAYAESYTSTTIKLGAGNAGIDYVSPAFTTVGFYNNGEFVAQYEDAHRQRNREKSALRQWGADPERVEAFYKNKAYTKIYRRRLFHALQSVPSEVSRVQLFHAAANVAERDRAEMTLVATEYTASLGAMPEVLDDGNLVIQTRGGQKILIVYADFLQWSPDVAQTFGRLRPGAVHIIGTAAPELKRQSQKMGIGVIEIAPKLH